MESIVLAMADRFLDPIMEKIISAGFRYLKDQFRWQSGMKEELEKLKENLPKIQAVFHFASSQGQITDQNLALHIWLWQLRDAINDAEDVIDELKYMEFQKQLTKNKKLRRVRSIMKSMKKKLAKIGKRALKIDPTTLKRLEEALQELYKVSTTGVDNFLRLAIHAKQELQKQQLELHGAREMGSLPKNDLIGRGKVKKLVMERLKNPSKEPQGTDLVVKKKKEIVKLEGLEEDECLQFLISHAFAGLPTHDLIGRGKEKELVMELLMNPSHDNRTTFYRNISLLCIMGHGGMGRTTLLQHIYEDERTKEFDLKMWVCVSNNFDVKKVIADMLESLDKKKPDLDSLDALQGRLQIAVRGKKFLLILDDIWVEEENRDMDKWENVLAPLAYGKIGSRILATTQMDSFAMMIAAVIKKRTEIFRLEC